MITLTASAEFGKSGRQYVARITGRHSKYVFAREFLGRKTGKRHEYTEADVDDPGLYEVTNVGKKGKESRHVFVLHVGPYLREFACTKTDAMRVARALDSGLPFAALVRPNAALDGYEVLTPAEARREQRQADQAVTVEAAAARCWEVLQALPAPLAAKVLRSLKRRLTPPAPGPDSSGPADAPSPQES